MSRSAVALAVGLAVAGILNAIGAAVSWAQEDSFSLPRCSPKSPRFCADAAFFLADTSSVLEVYFDICNEGLQFVKTDDTYRASADLSAVVRDGKGDQIGGDTYRIRLSTSTYSATTAVDSCTTRVLAFGVGPGDFKMGLGLYDRDSRVKSEIEGKLRVPGMSAFPSMSDVELLVRGNAHEGDRKGFSPNVGRLYSAESDTVFFYYEVYHGEGADTLRLAGEILVPEGAPVLKQSAISVGPGKAGHVEMFAVDSLANGRYSLKVSLLDSKGQASVSRTKEFEIRHGGFRLSKDVDEAVALLTYIASSTEIEAFTKANEQERKRLWDQFWLERDPTPGTPRNEFFEEHLRRFRYANEHFPAPLTPGWKSDRGRIYIIYGEPDEVESRSYEMGEKPTEVWYYLTKGRRFVFVDETGFGDYELVGGGG